MGKLVVGTFLTVDGVMQAPGGPEEDPSAGFAYGGWLVPHFDDTLGQAMDDWVSRLDALLLGRKTYDIFAPYWSKVTDPDNKIATVFNRAPKLVASRTLTDPQWNNTTVLSGDVAKEVAEAKDRFDGEIQVHGSGSLVQALMRHDLIDEYRLKTAPVILGIGKRLFADGTVPAGLKLAESTTTPHGVTMQVYRRTSGDVPHGSFDQ